MPRCPPASPSPAQPPAPRSDAPSAQARGAELWSLATATAAITDERFVYDRCRACGTVFLANVPDDLARYYGGDYYGFRPDGEADWQGNDYLLEFQSYRLELLSRHVQALT